MKKGLRQPKTSATVWRMRQNGFPDEEGIKTHRLRVGQRASQARMDSLMKKGLRRRLDDDCSPNFGQNGFPDEEGIKTRLFDIAYNFLGQNGFPDEEGIKTPAGCPA